MLVAVRGLIDVNGPATFVARQPIRVRHRDRGAGGRVVVGHSDRRVDGSRDVAALVTGRRPRDPMLPFSDAFPARHRYSDLERHPDNELIPGVLLFRVEASLLYFNVDHVRNRVWRKSGGRQSLRLVVCDLSNSPYVDVAGATMLAALHKDLVARGVQLRIVEAHAKARDLLRAEGLEDQVGYFGRHMSVDQAIAELAAAIRRSVERVQLN